MIFLLKGATNPLPLLLSCPLLYPLPTATGSPATQCPPGRKNREAQRKLGMGKGMNKGKYQDGADRARQKRCRAQKEEKERTNRKESLWLLEALVRKVILQLHTPACTTQC